MKNKILIIEDDREICAMVSDYLNKNGYDTIQAHQGVEGLELAQKLSPSLILLDLMLPYKSGDQLLKELRMMSDIPVIVVSAKDLIQTKVDLLQLGADDYLTKPFDFTELLARIEVNLRRYLKGQGVGDLLVYKEINLNRSLKTVVVDGMSVTLTPKEYCLLEMMILTPQQVFSKQRLYESVWNELYAYDDHTINTHISNLRKKLKACNGIDYIQTVWGMGYKLN